MEDLGTLKPPEIDPTLTEIEDKHTRASVEYWKSRVRTVGNHKSPFLDKPQEEIDSFTERHRRWVIPRVQGKDVLEIGCGYGRNMDMFTGVRSYMGLECVPELLEEARANLIRVFGKNDMRVGVHLTDLRTSTFGADAKYYEFDVCVAIAVVSSVESYFHDLRKRIMDSLRTRGFILWLEEDYVRMDYK